MKQTKPTTDATPGAGTGRPPKVQGEGDYEAARHHREDLKEFVDSGKVDEAARAATPRNEDEAQEMERAEKAGKARSKGEDPALKGKH